MKSAARPMSTYRWLSLAALCVCILIISLDVTIVNVALPTLAEKLKATASQLQWFVDAYTLIYAGLLLTTGNLGDRFGRKRALMIGMLLFGGGSVWAAYATSAEILIAARTLSGIGGALIMPSTLSITANLFPDKQRESAIGVLTGVGGLGIVIGPLLGGWLLEHFAWGTVFLINVPVILVALLVSWWLIPESKDPDASPLDPVGALLSIAGLMALLYGIIEVPTYGWNNAGVIAAFIAAPILLLAFIVWELRCATPMLDMKLFRNPRFSAASMALTLTSFAMVGTLFFLTQYLQLVLGYTPLQAGLCFIPLVAGLIVSASLSPFVSRKLGTRTTVTLGLAMTAIAIACFALLNTSSSYLVIGAVLILLGKGIGLAMVPATNAIMSTLPLGRAGVGSAVNDTAQEVGNALGVAVLGSVLAAGYHAAIDHQAGISALPAALRAIVHDSIGGAMVVASQVPDPLRHLITNAAQNAFIDGLHPTALIATVVSLGGVFIALIFLPSRSKEAAQADLTKAASTSTMEQKEEAAI